MAATMGSSIYTTAASCRSSSDGYLSFLDYPHAHDPTSISDIAALSTDLLRQLPTEAQDSLWLLQESTSVVYASYTRLQDLVEERFERLSYLTEADSYSEHAFANYVNQLTVEQSYLLRDAYPDWKHKLSMVRLDPYLDLTFKFQGRITIWFTNIQDSVTEWAQQARAVEAPDFDETVSEYSSQSTTPTSISSSDSLAKDLGVTSTFPKVRCTNMEKGVGAEHVENAMRTKISKETDAMM